MKYMLLIYGAEDAWTDEDRTACYIESAQFAQRLKSQKQYIDANPLQSVQTATSVRVRDGRSMVTDGPFAETREQLGGYFLIEAQDLDEAIGVAAQIPGARKGTVEVRPLLPIDGLPD
jgi:hypothetical protein